MKEKRTSQKEKQLKTSGPKKEEDILKKILILSSVFGAVVGAALVKDTIEKSEQKRIVQEILENNKERKEQHKVDTYVSNYPSKEKITEKPEQAESPYAKFEENTERQEYKFHDLPNMKVVLLSSKDNPSEMYELEQGFIDVLGRMKETQMGKEMLDLVKDEKLGTLKVFGPSIVEKMPQGISKIGYLMTPVWQGKPNHAEEEIVIAENIRNTDELTVALYEAFNQMLNVRYNDLLTYNPETNQPYGMKETAIASFLNALDVQVQSQLLREELNGQGNSSKPQNEKAADYLIHVLDHGSEEEQNRVIGRAFAQGYTVAQAICEHNYLSDNDFSMGGDNTELVFAQGLHILYPKEKVSKIAEKLLPVVNRLLEKSDEMRIKYGMRKLAESIDKADSSSGASELPGYTEMKFSAKPSLEEKATLPRRVIGLQNPVRPEQSKER